MLKVKHTLSLRTNGIVMRVYIHPTNSHKIPGFTGEECIEIEKEYKGSHIYWSSPTYYGRPHYTELVSIGNMVLCTESVEDLILNNLDTLLKH